MYLICKTEAQLTYSLSRAGAIQNMEETKLRKLKMYSCVVRRNQSPDIYYMHQKGIKKEALGN